MDSAVHIISKMKLQTELMAVYIQESTGLKCACQQNLRELPSINKRDGKRAVILWDSFGKDIANLWDGMGEAVNAYGHMCYLALFNARSDLKVQEKAQKEALRRGLRGIFFEDAPPAVFSKGITAILSGELWFSRETLSKCVMDNRNDYDDFSSQNSPLTCREKEVIFLIASGACNDEIAENLNISPHTVKTHIYNIYKKINANSRIQAALWAAKHL